MIISIKAIRTGNDIDASMYFVYDGPELVVDSSFFHIGHHVELMYPITDVQQQAIYALRETNRPSDAVQLSGYPLDGQYVFLGFTVIGVTHTLEARKLGQMHLSGHTVQLQARDWITEDILLWIIHETVPSWGTEGA